VSATFTLVFPTLNYCEPTPPIWRGRNGRPQYGATWEAKFRERFERDMIQKYDTHFMVGTVHKHPKNWIIVGLFYPPKREADLFDGL
jgi:hypothetical protein